MATLSVRRHNETVLRQLEPGDMIEFPRNMWYSHYAVYAGHGTVIHLSGENDGIGDGWQSNSKFSIAGEEFNKAWVKEEDFFEVAMGSRAKKNNKDHKYTPIGRGMDIVRRARAKLGEIGYSVLCKNCEHFAAWCRYGVSWSEQVDKAVTFAAVTCVVGAFVGLAMGMGRSRRNANN
ncbi:phospholipase A and acyltransferase 2-like [Liolophura sinensis]|uniref:phospholipase A and acyltransferase 2-like n=1 Tax=Liolophura sinensis TaxID=3198878 RepID=UPI003158D6B4